LEPLAAQQDSSVLPNWGASQLFSAPSRAASSDNTSSSIALPREGREVSVDERPSSSVEPETEEEQQRKGKGKAKAATVEDTVDEAEGS
jgi:E3 ubiquitin-protein ligase synoviolin